MMTKNKIIDDVLLRISKGKPSNDIELERSQLEHWINIVGDELIRDSLKAGLVSNTQVGQNFIYNERNLSVDTEYSTFDTKSLFPVKTGGTVWSEEGSVGNIAWVSITDEYMNIALTEGKLTDGLYQSTTPLEPYGQIELDVLFQAHLTNSTGSSSMRANSYGVNERTGVTEFIGYSYLQSAYRDADAYFGIEEKVILRNQKNEKYTNIFIRFVGYQGDYELFFDGSLLHRFLIKTDSEFGRKNYITLSKKPVSVGVDDGIVLVLDSKGDEVLNTTSKNFSSLSALGEAFPSFEKGTYYREQDRLLLNGYTGEQLYIDKYNFSVSYVPYISEYSPAEEIIADDDIYMELADRVEDIARRQHGAVNDIINDGVE